MSKLKVLVVEDEEDILEVIRYNLEQEGYEVISCMDGLQGLEQARKLKPDLVLLDIMLPGMDGVEVCRNLKEACFLLPCKNVIHWLSALGKPVYVFLNSSPSLSKAKDARRSSHDQVDIGVLAPAVLHVCL